MPLVKNRKKLEKLSLDRFLAPIQRFLKLQAAGGIVLFAVTIIAILWANSALSDIYFKIWSSTFALKLNDFFFEKSFLHWVNDGLMAIFFLVVGLEIKRELLIGELSSVKQALLPVIAAIGGMIVPAVIYFIFNLGTPTERGWGIPVATDIAFSLGVLSLLGKRVPFSLKVFLTAFAIIDDIGAVLVIAIFYTTDLNLVYLGFGFILIFTLILFNLLRINRPFIYILVGLAVWFAFLKSGVHSTVAGVLIAFTIPTREKIKRKEYINICKDTINEMEKIPDDNNGTRAISTMNSCVNDIKTSSDKVISPAYMLEYRLQPYVVFLILPLFAIANMGLVLDSNLFSNFDFHLFLGISLGLFIGKQVGIFSAVYISHKLKITQLPTGSNYKQIYGVACLGGVGFTMSLFIASLAFPEAIFLDTSKAAILTGSIVSGITGCIILYLNSRKNTQTK